MMRIPCHAIAGIVGLLVVSTGLVIACQVPVFRYALERWEVDDYRIVVFERGERTPATTALIDRLRAASRHVEGGSGNANLVIELADIENLTDAQQWSLQGWEDIKTFPAMQVYYPEATGIESPLWQGQLDTDSLQSLLASPLRSNLVSQIVAGNSAVWLLMESGDTDADDAAEKQLNGYLASAAAGLEIPEGVIRPEQLEDALNQKGKPIEMDDVLRSRIPLQIAFSIIRVDPTDSEESIFYRMLTHVTREENAQINAEPVAIPVFGRGRMMPGIPASRFSAASIATATGYLCGACSCQVKEQNPGLDLLVDTDWASHMQDGLIVTERELPPLSGAGDIIDGSVSAETLVNVPTEISGQSPPPNLSEPPASSSETKPNESPAGHESLLAVLGAACLVVAGSSVLYWKRQAG